MSRMDDRKNKAGAPGGASAARAVDESHDAAAPRRRWPRRLAIVLVALAVLAFVGAGAFVVYASDYYRSTEAAQQSMDPTAAVPIEQGNGFVAFGDPAAETGIVFYPGAKVEYTAYAPLMRDLAERGYLAVIVEMPFNFAFFDIVAADRVRAAFPAVDRWWVGGHSLGGSMAAQYAVGHASDLEGLLLCGAYTASDLSGISLDVLVVYGSEDGVLDRGKLADSTSLMPGDARIAVIEGGNHAYFGSYGEQDGDGEAAISPEEQQAAAADLADERLRAHEGS